MNPRDIETLRVVQQQWQAAGSLESGLESLVKVAGCDRLVRSHSFLGWLFRTFSLRSSQGRLEDVRRVAFKALKDDESCRSALTPLLNARFLHELAQHKIRWIASSGSQQSLPTSPGWSVLDGPLRKVKQVASERLARLQEKVAAQLQAALASLHQVQLPAVAFTDQEIGSLYEVDSALRGDENVERWLDPHKVDEQRRQWDSILRAMREHRDFESSMKTSDGPSSQKLKQEAKRLSQLAASLPVGESFYLHTTLGSSNFWSSKAWDYLKANYGIDAQTLEGKLSEIIRSGKIGQLQGWLDGLFDQLIPKELASALDTATAPIHMAHRVAGPLLPNDSRKVKALHALFPAFIAEFLESKAQGGVARVLEPILPGSVGELSRLLTTLPIDARHTLSQSLREKAQGALEELSLDGLSGVAQYLQELLHAPDEWLRVLPDQSLFREAILKQIAPSYDTPGSCLFKITRRPQGPFELTLVSSGSTVGKYHPRGAGGQLAPFYFSSVPPSLLDESFFHRLLEWSQASTLMIEPGDERVFYEQFLSQLGTVQALEGQSLEADSLPYFNQERALQMMGMDIQAIHRRTDQLRIQAFVQVCLRYREELEDLEKPLPTQAYSQLSGLIKVLRQRPVQAMGSVDIESSLRAVSHRLQYEAGAKPGQAIQSDLLGMREHILDSMQRHPVLLKWLLGEDAEKIYESLSKQLGLEGQSLPRSGAALTWLERNKGFFLEVIYASAMILVFYTTGLLVSTLKISASAAFALLTRYLARRFDWQQVLPTPAYELLHKIGKLYNDLWTWVLLKIREIFVAIAMQVINRKESLKSLRVSLEVIQKSKQQLRDFLDGVDPAIEVEKNVKIQKISAQVLVKAQATKAVVATGSFYTFEFAQLHFMSASRVARLLGDYGHLSLQKVITFLQTISDTDPELMELLRRPSGRRYFLKKLEGIISKFAPSPTYNIDQWQLRAYCFLWMQQVLKIARASEQPCGDCSQDEEVDCGELDAITREQLLDELSLGWAVDEEHDLRLYGASQAKHLQRILTALYGKKMSFSEIRKELIKKRQALKAPTKSPAVLSCEPLRTLPVIKDSLLPSRESSLLSKGVFRSMLPYAWTGGIDQRYAVGYAWIKACRKWLNRRPNIKEQLAKVAAKWLHGRSQEIRDKVIASFDQETLLICVFNEILGHHAIAEELFEGRYSWRQAVRLQIALGQNALFIKSQESRNSPFSLDLLVQAAMREPSEKDGFRRKCLFMREMVPVSALSSLPTTNSCATERQQEVEVSSLGSSAFSDDQMVEKQLVEALEATDYPRYNFSDLQSCTRDEVGSEKDTQILRQARERSGSSSNRDALASRDIESSQLKGWSSFASRLSFLSAHPTWLFDKAKAREELLASIDQMVLMEEALIEDRSIAEEAAACWRRLWEAAPSSKLYKHWLLLLGFKLQSRLSAQGQTARFSLLENLRQWQVQLQRESDGDYFQNLLATLQVKIAFHPEIGASDAQRELALETYLTSPVLKVPLTDAQIREMSQFYAHSKLGFSKEIFLQGFYGLSGYDFIESSQEFVRWLCDASQPRLQAIFHRVAAKMLGRPIQGQWVFHLDENFIEIPQLARIDLGTNRVEWIDEPTKSDPFTSDLACRQVFASLGLADRALWKEEKESERWRCGLYVYEVKGVVGTLHYENEGVLYAYSGDLYKIENPCEPIKSWIEAHPTYHIFSGAGRYYLRALDGSYAVLKEDGGFCEAYTVDIDGSRTFMAEELPACLRALSQINPKGWLMTQAADGSLQEIRQVEDGLHFVLKGQTLHEVGRFKGYSLLSKQAGYASQLPWTGYLVLQNERGQRLVLTSKKGQLPQMAMRRFLPDIPLLKMLGYLFSGQIGHLFMGDHKPQASLGENALRVYALEPSGQLRASDFSSLLHLFLSYALQGNYEEAQRALESLEKWLSGPMKADISDQDMMLLCVDFIGEPMKLLRLRFAVALTQRQMHQQTSFEQTPLLKMGQIAFAATCLHDYHTLLHLPAETFDQLGFDVRDELVLTHFARSTQKEILRYIAENKKVPFLSTLNPDYLSAAVEASLYPEAVWKRMRLLEDWQSKSVSDGRLLDWEQYASEALRNITESYASMLQQFHRLSVQWLDRSQSSHFLYQAVNTWVDRSRRRLGDEGVKKYLEARLRHSTEYSAPLRDLTQPLNASLIRNKFIAFYKLASSCEETAEKAWLRRQLRLHVGGWSPQSALEIEFLTSLMAHPQEYLPIERLLEDRRTCLRGMEVDYPSELEKRLAEEKLREADLRITANVVQFLKRRDQPVSRSFFSALVPKSLSYLAHASTNVASQLGLNIPALTAGLPVGLVMDGLEWARHGLRALSDFRRLRRVDRICYTKLRDQIEPASASHLLAHTLGSIDQDIQRELSQIDATLSAVQASPEQLAALPQVLLPLSKRQEAWEFYRLQQGFDGLQTGQQEVLCVDLKEEDSAQKLYRGLRNLEARINASIESSETNLQVLVGRHILRLVGSHWLDRLSHLAARGELASFFPELDPEQIEAVEILVTNRLMLKARLAQVQQAQELFKKLGQGSEEERRETLIQLHAKLTRTRQWSFDKMPWKMVLPILAFEGQCGVLLTPVQVEKMAQALNQQRDVVFEAIMGGGKSFFGQTFEEFMASSMGLAVLMYPSNVIQAGSSTAAEQASLAYGQRPYRLILHPAPTSESDWLSRLMALRSAVQAKQPISVSPEDVQSLLLNWYGGLYLGHTSSRALTDRSLEAMQEMVALLKAQGISIGDEAHILYDPKKSLRLPLGVRSSCKREYLEGMSLLWFWLSSDSSLMKDLHDQTCYNKPEAVTLEKYSSKVANRLESMYGIEGLARFFCDMKYEPEGLAQHPQYELFCLYRGILAVCLPQALKGSLDVNYGPHPDFARSPAVPYRGSDCPLKESIFRNPFESLTKSFISSTGHGVPLADGAQLIYDGLCMESGFNRSEELPTMVALIAKVKKDSRWQDAIAQAMRDQTIEPLKAIAQELAHDPLLVGCFIANKVAPNLEAWSMSLNCDPQMMASMFARNVAATGTAAIEGIYPHGMQVQRDERASADALVTLLVKTSSVSSLASDNPSLVLQELLDKHLPAQSKVRAWLDGAALLHGLSMKYVAQAVGERLRDSIDVVLYYEGDTLMAWHIERQESVLAQTISVEPSRRFTIYDQSHTIGADIPQSENAQATLLVSSTLQGTAQEGYRLRKLAAHRVASQLAKRPIGQSLSMVLSASTRAQFDHDPTVVEVIEHVMGEEVGLAKSKNFDAALQKIHAAILERACEALLAESNLTARKKLAYRLAPLFVEYQTIDAKKMFGGLFKDEEPRCVLIEKSRNLRSIAESLGLDCKGLFEQLQQLIDQTPSMPACVRVSEAGESLTIGLEASLSLNLSQEQQQEVTVSSTQQITYKPMDYARGLPTHDDSWLSHTPIPGEPFSAKSPRAGVPMYRLDRLVACDDVIGEYAPLFEDSIYVTNNLLPIQGVGPEGPARLGSLLVRPCRSALVYYDLANGQVHSVVALSSKDHAFWKHKIETSAPTSSMRCLLWDIHAMCPIATYQDDQACGLIDMAGVRRKLLKLKIALGYVNFPLQEVRGELTLWLDSHRLGIERLIEIIRALLSRRGEAKSHMEFMLIHDLWQLSLEQERTHAAAASSASPVCAETKSSEQKSLHKVIKGHILAENESSNVGIASLLGPDLPRGVCVIASARRRTLMPPPLFLEDDLDSLPGRRLVEIAPPSLRNAPLAATMRQKRPSLLLKAPLPGAIDGLNVVLEPNRRSLRRLLASALPKTEQHELELPGSCGISASDLLY